MPGDPRTRRARHPCPRPAPWRARRRRQAASAARRARTPTLQTTTTGPTIADGSASTAASGTWTAPGIGSSATSHASRTSSSVGGSSEASASAEVAGGDRGRPRRRGSTTGAASRGGAGRGDPARRRARRGTSLCRARSESITSTRPSSGSPIPAMSLIASVAMREPTCRQRAPSTPTWAHVGTSPTLPWGYRSDSRTAGAPAGGRRPEHRDLRIERLHGAPDEGQAELLAGGGDGLAGVERVGAVEHEVRTGEQIGGVVAGQALPDGDDPGLGGEVGRDARRAGDLGRTDIRQPVHHLALQIGCLDRVVVDDRDRADPRGREGQDDRVSRARRRRPPRRGRRRGGAGRVAQGVRGSCAARCARARPG